MLAWNVRGLNNYDKQGRIHEEIKKYKASAIFLIETKLRKDNLKKAVSKIWRQSNRLSNNDSHPLGRILIMWDSNKIHFDLICSSAQYIHMFAHLPDMKKICVTVVYGFNSEKDRSPLWDFLSSISTSMNLPWIVVGDFNSVRNSNERIGKNAPTKSSISDFNKMIKDADLLEIPSKGPWFTWDNRQFGSDLILSKIDRGLTNALLLKEYPNMWLEVVSNIISDHRILVLHYVDIALSKKGSFRFINSWAFFEGYKAVIENAWNTEVNGNPMFKVVSKLKHVKSALLKWNKEKVGDIFDEARIKMQEATDIQKLLDMNPSDTNLQTKAKEYREEALKLSHAEESLLRQKSRNIWLKEGDRNSKFFYTSLQIRRKRNEIRCLDIKEKRCDDLKLIEEHIADFYKDFFNQEDNSSIQWKEDYMLPKLNQDDIAFLSRLVTQDEIDKVIQNANPNKSPGPDGFNGFFFKNNWNLIKQDVSKAVLNFFSSGRLLKEVNRTYIVLLPKGEDTKNIKGFRPISLCNFIYKIISKILTNRLREVLPHIISDSQFAFIKGRSMIDAILLANDIINDVVKGKDKFMCIKADLRKAYDSVRWPYILLIMKNMGFPICWINWVQVMLETSSFQVLLNGAAGPPFKSSNGLRQGDPLAPYLFVIAMEGLSAMLNHAKANKRISVPIVGNDISVSHILYTDDLLIFSRSNSKEAAEIKSIMEEFATYSGLKMNPEKSQLFLNSKCNEHCLEKILNITKHDLPIKYLGLPLFAGHLNQTLCLPLIDKIRTKLDSWKANLLSQAGRLELIISTLRSYHLFWSMAFPIPKATIKNIEKLIRDFLWGDNNGGKKIHTIRWEEICVPREEGGLGIKSCKDVCKAYLVTKTWSIAKNKNDLWIRWIHGKYLGRKNSIWSVIPKPNDYWIWKRILSIRDQIRPFVSFHVGNGDNIRLWLDPWVSNGNFLTDIVEENMVLALGKGRQCLLNVIIKDQCWSIPDTRRLAIMKSVFNNLSPPREGEDAVLFKGLSELNYKRAWEAIRMRSQVVPWSTWLWKTKCPRRTQVHVWKCMKNAILTHDNMRKHGMTWVSRCVLCNDAYEDLNHILFCCNFSVNAWNEANNRGLCQYDCPKSMDEVISNKNRRFKTFICLFWAMVWEERNIRIFEGHQRSFDCIIKKISWDLDFFS